MSVLARIAFAARYGNSARTLLALFAACGANLVACTPTTDLGGGEGLQAWKYDRVAITQGSAVAVTRDERVAIVTQRTDGIVSVLHLDSSKGPNELVLERQRTELPFHPLNGSKPWAAVIGADDDTAYVLLRGSGQVVRIGGLHGATPRETGRVIVGSEPTSIVISPSGKNLYVANSGEGTISTILTQDLSASKWDLNLRLANTGVVGPLVASTDLDAPPAVWSNSELERFRPALAHPRALAITDDGDTEDGDETLYATEFFSQPLPDPTLSDPDRSRQGLVYPIIVGKGAGHATLDAERVPIDAIPLAAMDTGFLDSEQNPTGCFPNQLYGATAKGNRLFVTSLCASPSGPVEAGPSAAPTNNFRTLVHPAVLAIDTTTNQQVSEESVVLTQALDRLYAADATDAADRRMPLIPNEIVLASATAPGITQAYVTAFGASAVFPIRYNGNGVEIGSEAQRFIDLGSTATPIGMATLSSRPWALVLDDRKPAIAVVDLDASRVAVWKDTRQQDWGTDPAELVADNVREGRRLFATGLEAWSLGGLAWSSCESCHPEGLSDGVVWQFSRGPRRSISLAGTYYRDDPRRRMLLWSANIDEIHDIEAIARGVSGGVGGVVWNPYTDAPHKDCRLSYDGKAPEPAGGSPSCGAPKPTTHRLTGLTGSLAAITVTTPGGECIASDATCDINGSTDWDKIDAFIRSVRAPRAPTTLDRRPGGRVETGERLFREHRCAACHGGPGWTLSRVFYDPGLPANGQVPYRDPRATNPDYSPDARIVRELLGELRSTSYRIPDGAPPEFALANPVVRANGATFRSAPPAGSSAAQVLDYLYATGKMAPLDQVNCVLRAVGTFPKQTDGAAPNFLGVVPEGAPPVRETRRILDKQSRPDDPSVLVDVYVEELALGSTGFNIPSLVGLAGGGPYFHAGNARTLEELFEPSAFSAHHAALAPGFQPTGAEVQALVSYLLSIDESDDSKPIAAVSSAAGELEFDPDLCAQFARAAGN